MEQEDRVPVTTFRRDATVEFHGSWVFGRSPQDVWDELVRVNRYGSWWRWLHDFSATTPQLCSGTVLTGVVKPPLPYRMQLQITVTECEVGRGLAAEVTGDLTGQAQAQLSGDGSGSARVDAAWWLQMRQPEMRAAARVAPPMLAWGHDRVVDRAVGGFRRALQLDK